jgi:hypothetical protein
MGSNALVIYEDGERTGHITADGLVGYVGDNTYISDVLDHSEGGRVYVRPAEETDEIFGTASVAERSEGEDLFDAVRGRIEPLPTVETSVKRDHGED